MVDLIEKDHGKIVIVDLPIPKGHSDQSPYFRDYQKKKINFLNKITASKNVCYLNYQDMNSDIDFYDSVHPKAATAKKWSARLGTDLMKIYNILK